MDVIEAVRWAPQGLAVRIIDQRRLPAELVERDLRSLDDVCHAIATLAVRGAPAIGVAAAMGIAMVAEQESGRRPQEFRDVVIGAASRIRATRPTAVNLGWAVDRMLERLASAPAEPGSVASALRLEAAAIRDEDRAMCRRIGEHALPLLSTPARVLTHCNAGALATAGIGTALAPIYLAAAEGRDVRVFVGETRPLLQGARLTSWELSRAGIPVTVLPDNAIASLLRSGAVDCCIVGADRIAANGDVANKIGTYAVALAAARHGIPFYVAAPTSTFDPSFTNGSHFVIEERSRDELAGRSGSETIPAAAAVYNPAFDVTPGDLITAIVSDQGVFRPPYRF